GRETIARVDDEGRHVRAVVGASDVMLASVEPDALPAFLTLAGELELALGDVFSGGDRTIVHLPLLNVPDWARCERELGRAFGGRVSLEGTHAVATVVGHGLTGTSGALARCLAILSA